MQWNIWFILEFVWSLLQVNESASVMLLQTWHRLPLHLYEPTVLSKWYSLALMKLLLNFQALRNETMGHGVNTSFTSLSIQKTLRFISKIALIDFSKGWYITNAIAFILWLLQLLFDLKWGNLTYSFQNWSGHLGTPFS